MKKILLILPIFIAMTFLTACNQKKAVDVMTTPDTSDTMMKDDTSMKAEKDKQANTEGQGMMEDEEMGDEEAAEMVENLSEGDAVYIEYTPSKLAEYKGSKPVALFFHASWCPTCRALNNDLEESIPNLTGVNVIKIDYDTETELKKEYGITVQHTVIFLNADGTVADKKVGARLNDIVSFFSS